jgi:hypothetical protein
VPTIASTFWKKLIHGAIWCDQSTFFDSSSCSRKFLGDDARAQLDVGERRALGGLVGAAALEVLAHRPGVEAHDLLAVDATDLAVVVGDELCHAHNLCATSA